MSIEAAEQFIADFDDLVARYPYRNRALVLRETLGGLGVEEFLKITQGLIELSSHTDGENRETYDSLAARVKFVGKHHLGIDFT